MSIDKRIIEEINRYNTINRYISEQETPNLDDLEKEPQNNPETGGNEGDGLELDINLDDVPEEGGTPEGDMGGAEEFPEPVDVESDPEVDVVGDNNTETTDVTGDVEELDITDLVTKQDDILNKQEEYMSGLFNKLENLTSTLNQMDAIFNKINQLEVKVEKMKPKTPEEKLQLRSLDSYPYNQKLTDFFTDKEQEMEMTGKNEYVLTPDDVKSYSERDIKDSFDEPFREDEYKI